MIVSYLVGASMVDGVGPPWATPAFYLLPIQAAVSRALLELVIPAARAADRAAAARRATAVALEVATARRTAEREHWAVLHDTAGVDPAHGRRRCSAERGPADPPAGPP